jgi:hypothetical protein
MPAGFDPADYDLPSSTGDDAPAWRSRFVRDEVRPVLLQHRQAVLEARDRWLADHEERKRRLAAWEARRDEFLRQLAALPEDQRHGPEPPAEGLVRVQGRVAVDDKTTMLVAGWGPPDLAEYSGPPVEYPLPPPRNRDLSPDECWVALVAVHDATRDPREWLGPDDSIPMEVLRRRALGLTEEHLEGLRMILRTALPPPPPADRKTAPSRGEVEGDRDRSVLERMALAELLTTGPNASQIAKRLGVPRTTLLGWPTFRDLYDRAKQDQEIAKRSRRRGRRAGRKDFEAEEGE